MLGCRAGGTAALLACHGKPQTSSRRAATSEHCHDVLWMAARTGVRPAQGWTAACWPSAGAACLQGAAASPGWPAASHTSAGIMPAALGSVASTSATRGAAEVHAGSVCRRGVRPGPPTAVEAAERRNTACLGLGRVQSISLPASGAQDARLRPRKAVYRKGANTTWRS